MIQNFSPKRLQFSESDCERHEPEQSAAIRNCAGQRLTAVIASVMFARLFSMVNSVHVVPLCDVRMVTRCFVIGRVVVFGRQAMMLGGVFVMFSGFAMMICSLL